MNKELFTFIDLHTENMHILGMRILGTKGNGLSRLVRYLDEQMTDLHKIRIPITT